MTYIGGMQTTPGARYDPRRTVEPPGTMRTPASGENGRVGYVSLSKKANGPTRLVHDLAHAEAEQDAALDPGVGAPAAAGVALGGAGLAGFERVEEVGDRRAGLVAVGSVLGGEGVEAGLEIGHR